VKLTYNALLEKAETREKERLKEEAKKMRKVEGELRFVFSHRAEFWLSRDRVTRILTSVFFA
jgi:pre-mRNA-processing factor 40